jgi:hypothetical protein
VPGRTAPGVAELLDNVQGDSQVLLKRWPSPPPRDPVTAGVLSGQETTMSSRALPPSIEHVLAAARRIHPAHGLFVTIETGSAGPQWEFHPFKRWLILRTRDQGPALEAVACSLLARTAWLGNGAVTSVPERLHERFRQALDALRAALQEEERI